VSVPEARGPVVDMKDKIDSVEELGSGDEEMGVPRVRL
jgi:hypothetical protein